MRRILLALSLSLITVTRLYALPGPTNLTAQAVSSSRINLKWQDNSSGAAGFKIQRSPDGITFALIAQVSAGVTSYANTGLPVSTKFYYRVRIIDGGVSPWSNIASATTALVLSGGGIASRYPGDRGIGFDPDVLLADDFESYTTSTDLLSKWSRVQGASRIVISTTQHFAGNKSAEFELPVSSAEHVDEIFHDMSPGFDTLFCRVYMKWDAGYSLSTSNHNGIHMRGGHATAGVKCDGIGCFVMLLQNNNIRGETPPGYLHEYAYWPSQNSGYGDHWYPTGQVIPSPSRWLSNPAQYPGFTPRPDFLPQRDKWYCYEHMVKLNTVGQNNGEVKAWVDGVLVADWTNLVIRKVDTLKIDDASLDLHSIGSQRLNKKWYDNVVIAKSYIGPMQ